MRGGKDGPVPSGCSSRSSRAPPGPTWWSPALRGSSSHGKFYLVCGNSGRRFQTFLIKATEYQLPFYHYNVSLPFPTVFKRSNCCNLYSILFTVSLLNDFLRAPLGLFIENIKHWSLLSLRASNIYFDCRIFSWIIVFGSRLLKYPMWPHVKGN